ncbi:hypothetical protein B1756_07095 [Natrarchaeobaculum aegyptiacum]|uniref:SHSP domain-containing protein n=1 Tax=Natrarchaeobaculum aegyptiacum TaxID=745377 RepID=A0A2Z2HQU9_9EURY|nr:Hsp20/alpha crystallin family protein [Natrarchaeobaculum aegyptiacum]ARS89530.1 hypothetical protein B1756_07095 [Natrarchaeobaculum aegyptiacum]
MSLDDLTSTIGTVLYRQLGRANGHLQTTRSLPVDVLEGEQSYRVVFDAPGADPDDVQVRYVDGAVRVRIDRFREYRDGYEVRYPGRGMTLEGDVDLPDDAHVDPDAGTAHLSEAGTLRIDIPKSTVSGGTAVESDVDSDADAVTDVGDDVGPGTTTAPASDRATGGGPDTGPDRDPQATTASSERPDRRDGLQVGE